MYKNTTKKRHFRGGKPHAGSQRFKQRRNNNRGKQTINPAKFINRDVETAESVVEYTAVHSFTDFNLPALLQNNLEAAGFQTPSAIQDQTIPLGLQKKDVIGLANTGTGKTAAFLVPIIDSLYANREYKSVLIMAPTRELAQQIDSEFRKFAQGMKLFSAVCVGGTNIGPQLRDLRRNPHVVIGTPGRIKDHIARKSLDLSNVHTFVLDEADRMLDMGFVHDIREIASLIPTKRQTLCFSATLNDGVKKIVQDFMHEPKLVSVKVSETSDHIFQDVVHFSDNEHKKDLLIAMLKQDDFERVIVFGETKFGVQRLSDNLERVGIASRAIHGNKTQGQRNRALNDFKENKSKVLVATDVAARGLDISDVSHVINYDLPQTYDDYVHRIGRTGRGGKAGSALTFVQSRR